MQLPVEKPAHASNSWIWCARRTGQGGAGRGMVGLQSAKPVPATISMSLKSSSSSSIHGDGDGGWSAHYDPAFAAIPEARAEVVEQHRRRVRLCVRCG